ncbi:hypothetical protein FWJ25_11115 [Marinobacter salinexigens]|uniref:Uncharacterized protein n=1 Tax=Marinobacter salinexigens TaxID=2919747 RepID=A0A5B0VJ54_9GAMM|nr:hypothetical protein [Marinobacter salinexigens]KAA1173949.1 hypothetical protein FWJ25_11115 [Marinobacter salinexigens]
MIQKPSIKQISRALFETDPMNTCCKENGCFDEYHRVAEAVSERLKLGCRLEQALIEEISAWFFDGDGFDSSRLQSTLDLLTWERE